MHHYREQLDLAINELAAINSILTHFLNHTTIDQLIYFNHDASIKYYEEILSSLRRLTVFTEDAFKFCSRLNHLSTVQPERIEKALDKIARQGIDEFFSPREDLWYENSRASYTDQPLILFRESVPEALVYLMAELGSHFEHLREEMEIYHRI